MSPSSSFIRRPSCALLALEPVRAALEFAGHTVMREASLPKGDQHAVVVFPGLATNATVMRPLQSFCERLGYRCFDWGQGLNTGPKGDVDAWLDTLAQDVQARTADHAAPISLVGWSLGGIYARQLAKRRPDKVRSVISLGSPFTGSPKATNAWRVYEFASGQSVEDSGHHIAGPLADPPPVPTTSIFSRTDGICAWQTCLNVESEQVENIEVYGSHCGLGHHPAAVYAVADRLSQPEGQWKRFDRSGWKSFVFPDWRRA